MNFTKSLLAGLISLSITGVAEANWEVSGFVKNETAVLQDEGTFTGQATSPTDTTVYNDRESTIKSESTLKMYVNGDLTDKTSVHGELNLVKDTTAKGAHFKNNESYTQNDLMRELYVDTLFGENDQVEVRLGKQQVVWGTADGMKLLDIVNPTDYREMAQNTMEDSRIPVWMMNVNVPVGDSGNVQVIASQPRENVFAGLNRNIDGKTRDGAWTASDTSYGWSSSAANTNPGHDAGNAFILKGVDSITGQRNGFLNVVPDIGGVADQFFTVFATNGYGGSLGYYSFGALKGSTQMTVGMFASFTSSQLYSSFGSYMAIAGNALQNYDGAATLWGFGGQYDTNLADATSSAAFGSSSNGSANTVFEFMDMATFETFDAFANAKSRYVFDMPDDTDLNLAARYKNSLDNGFNYSLAYSYNYDPNPVIEMNWVNNNGAALTKTITARNNYYSLSLADSTGQAYGGYAAALAAQAATSATNVTAAELDAYAPTLEFKQTLKRAHNLGAAFDYTLDTESLGGVVLRGEFLYQKDVYQPVVDLGALAIGDLTGGLSMEKADHFKYVIGADITVLTNMLVSGQFIQDRNLDYVDTTSAYHDRKRYTADFAAMHMSNGFKKAEKNKEFYSLFVSKPFGPNQLGRFNNILMLEEGGGRWNRFDIEYSLSDQLIGSIELNNYWGDADTQFGQLDASDNFQLGVKYLF